MTDVVLRGKTSTESDRDASNTHKDVAALHVRGKGIWGVTS
jgi:hypothetical protein